MKIILIFSNLEPKALHFGITVESELETDDFIGKVA